MDCALRSRVGGPPGTGREVRAFAQSRSVTDRSAHLVIDGPGYASLTLQLREGITTLGRLPANDVVLNDQQVSRHHARVSFFEGKATFQDLESHNGSLVNDKVTSTATLEPDDVIRVGPFRLRFKEGRPEGGTESARSVGRPFQTREQRSGTTQPGTSLLLRVIDTTLVSRPPDALERILAAVDKSMKCDRGAIIRLRADGQLTFAAGREAGAPNPAPTVQRGVVDWTVQRRFPVAAENPSADPRFSGTTSATPLACVPIGDGQQIWGTLYAERASPSFSLSDLDVLQAISHLLFAFLQRQQSLHPPWLPVDDGGSGELRRVAATVLVIEHALGAAGSDTVSDLAEREAMDPTFVRRVVEVAQKAGALWLPRSDRRIVLVFPDTTSERHPEVAITKRLAPILTDTKVKLRMGLGWGPVFLQTLRVPGGPRLVGWGEAVESAVDQLERARWGALRAPADRAASLEAGGLKVDASANGGPEVDLKGLAVLNESAP